MDRSEKGRQMSIFRPNLHSPESTTVDGYVTSSAQNLLKHFQWLMYEQ